MGRSRRFSPCWRRARQIIEASTPVRADGYTGPRFVLRRSRQIRFSVLASVRRGDRYGCELRSTNPASPYSTQRRHHLATVPRRSARLLCTTRLQEKPRQCTTDGRWWTAGRIGGNRSSPSGGAQPLSVAEGIVGLVVVVTAKAVLPLDVGLHRQSTPSGCPCGRLADNAGRSGPLQRRQEVRVTREQYHNVEVVVDCAKREVQTAAPRAAPPARRPCSERSGW